MNLQELLDMPLGTRRIIDTNTVVTRMPKGWIYGDMQGCCFVPEPEKELLAEVMRKKTVRCPITAQTAMHEFFESINWYEVDRIAIGRGMSEPEVLITYEGRMAEWDMDGFIKLIVDIKMSF